MNRRITISCLILFLLLYLVPGISTKTEASNLVLGDPNNTRYSYSQGSSYWNTSNIREWLNSNQEVVGYTSNPPSEKNLGTQAYDKEAGFLSNFTSEEQDAIAVTERRSFISGYDSAVKEAGTNNVSRTDAYMTGYFLQNISVNLDKNWKNIYYRTVKDKVFNLQINELYEYVQKRNIAYTKEPTAKVRSKYNVSAAYYPWMSSHVRRDVYAEQLIAGYDNNTLNSVNISSNLGVAPALHLKPDYTLSSGKKVSNLEINELVSFGNYEGEAIQWRVINKTPDGYALLWSEKVLTIKRFDAPGDDTLAESNYINFDKTDVSIVNDLNYYNKSGDTTEPVMEVVNKTDLDKMQNGSWDVVLKASDNSGIEYIEEVNGERVYGDTITRKVDKNGYYYFRAKDKGGNFYGFFLPIGNVNVPSNVLITTSADGWTNKDVTVNIKASNVNVGWSIDSSTISNMSGSSSPSWPTYTTYAGKRIKLAGTARLISHKADVGNYVTAISLETNYRVASGTNYYLNRDYPMSASIPLKDLLDGQPKTVEKIITVRGDYYNNLITKIRFNTNPIQNGNYTVEWTNVKAELLDNEDFSIDKIILPDGKEIKSNEYTDTLTSDGNYTYQVIDTRGMVTEKTVSVKIDKGKPAMDITGISTKTTNKDVDLQVTSNDSLSGVKRIQKPNGEWENTSQLTYKVRQNGTYTFIVEDNAGNQTSKSVTVNNIDKESPTLKVDVKPPSAGRVYVAYSATDTSGIKEIRVPKELKKDEYTDEYYFSTEGTYAFEAEDQAGNITTKTIDVTGSSDLFFEVSNSIDAKAELTGTGLEEYISDTDLVLHIADNRGKGYNWKLNVIGTPLTNENGKTLKSNSLQIKKPYLSAANALYESTDTPDLLINKCYITVDTPSPLRIAETDAESGKANGGWYIIFNSLYEEEKKNVKVDLPANVYKGTYESTITWQLVTAP
ncbi:WxL domain-containing protein [Bacillus sp. Au-Bac7]|uniref:WxL domain-containing protein n=1 Tax=Bacillus sp. Au-Bac7 TaxID=2906458 RepID=UPI001E5CAD5A|nr:WxL domain-containing protein [Bacillus sp. Au-Bac7]MCE4051683.1 WxL domain-containing protein [Bacillus sp. Au-Bac7]